MIKTPFIFLVDDDIDDQELFGDALKEVEPAAVLKTADDGLDAIGKLKKSDILPDLIFLDLNMPRLDGKGLLKEIKSNDRLRNITVIIYTTSSNPEEKRLTLESGASDFIVKHHSFNELCDALKKVLRQQQLINS